ncbi:MAG: LysR family transcriptional regulator [Solobacterium sp.]|nr:LysR family transcriptional regulator [Solobacterium sp.]
MLDTRLVTLLKVADVGNYTEAARQLNLTQPAVSQHIRALEEEFNVKLFERNGNKIFLTNEGKKVVHTAKGIRALYQNLHNELAQKIGGKQELHIGITHTVESNRITESFVRYSIENEGVTIKLLSANQNKLIRKIKNYELDFAIMDGEIDDATLHTLHMDEDHIMLIVAPDHPLAKHKSVNISQIKTENLILRLPNSGTGNLFKKALATKNLEIDDFQVKLEIENVATIKDLIRHGYGVSILPKSTCMDEISKKKLIALPIDDFDMQRQVNIVYGDTFQYMDFLEEILQIYRSL